MASSNWLVPHSQLLNVDMIEEREGVANLIARMFCQERRRKRIRGTGFRGSHSDGRIYYVIQATSHPIT